MKFPCLHNQVTLFALLVATLLLISFSSSARWQPRQNAEPLDLYNHAKHFGRYIELNVACDYCHQTPDSYTREKVYRMGCHLCHNNPQSPAPTAARFKCITCHKDLTRVKPESHYLNWVSRHQSVAKQDKNYCLKCHKSFYCTDCHQKRDAANQRMHTRLFRYYHSIEARSNPGSCTKCHNFNFCKDCHETSSSN